MQTSSFLLSKKSLQFSRIQFGKCFKLDVHAVPARVVGTWNRVLKHRKEIIGKQATGMYHVCKA